MLEIVQAGGWLMWPIIGCSVVAVAIILERLWTLQEKRVLPASVANHVWELLQQNQLDVKQIQEVHQSSPIGQVLAAGLAYRHASRDVLKEVVEDTGRHVVHDLERYLSPLGTIAAISPLLGLLGTVSGMIRSFTAITAEGVAEPGRARRRHLGGFGRDGGRFDGRHPGVDRLSLPARPRRWAGREDRERVDALHRGVAASAADGCIRSGR